MTFVFSGVLQNILRSGKKADVVGLLEHSFFVSIVIMANYWLDHMEKPWCLVSADERVEREGVLHTSQNWYAIHEMNGSCGSARESLRFM